MYKLLIRKNKKEQTRPLPLQLIFICLIAVAIVINIFQFPLIERQMGINWKAIHHWQHSRLEEISSVQRRYGLFLALSENAPGASLVVPQPKPPARTRLASFKHQIFGIGRISGMSIRDYDVVGYYNELTTVLNFDLNEKIISRGRYGNKGSYTIIAGDQTPIELIFLMPDPDDIIFIDTAIIPPRFLPDMEPYK